MSKTSASKRAPCPKGSVHAAGVPLALVRMQLVVERLEAAAEHVGRAALVALEMLERREDESAFDLLERRPDGHADAAVGGAGRMGAQHRHLVLGKIELAVAEDVRALDRISQLAHVARPGVADEARAQLIGEPLVRAVAQVELA